MNELSNDFFSLTPPHHPSLPSSKKIGKKRNPVDIRPNATATYITSASQSYVPGRDLTDLRTTLQIPSINEGEIFELRWSNLSNARHYVARIQTNLIEQWELSRAWGGKHSNSGGIENIYRPSLHDCIRTLAEIHKERVAHGYYLYRKTLFKQDRTEVLLDRIRDI